MRDNTNDNTILNQYESNRKKFMRICNHVYMFSNSMFIHFSGRQYISFSTINCHMYYTVCMYRFT